MVHLRPLPILLTVVATGRLVSGVFNCPADDGFTCSSCSTLVYCSGGNIAMELPCSTGQVCGGDPKICQENTDDSLKECTCGTEYPSYVEDPYDDQKFLICLSSSLQVPESCPGGQVFDSANPPCVAGPATTTQQPIQCTETGIFPVLPGCAGYYGCFSDGSGGVTATPVTDCDGDKVFNPDSRTCVDSIDVPNATCSADKAAVVDTVECNAFHICNGEGDPISGPICCPAEGQVFNSETMICEADKGQVECPTPNPCVTGEDKRSCLPLTTTTSLTSSATPPTGSVTPPTGSATPPTGSATPQTDSATPTTGSATPPTGSARPPTDRATPPTSGTIKTESSTASSTTTASIPDCSSNTGAHPIPGDCKKYYYCHNGKLYTQSCTGQLVFNPTINMCDLPSNYPQCA